MALHALLLLQYEGIDVQLESTMDRAIKEPVVSEALALASKLLLRPEKKKMKDAMDSASASSTAAAAKRAGTKAQSGCAVSAGRSMKGKARGAVPKGKKTDPPKLASSLQEGETKDFASSSLSASQSPPSVTPSEAGSSRPTLRRTHSMQTAAYASEVRSTNTDRNK